MEIAAVTFGCDAGSSRAYGTADDREHRTEPRGIEPDTIAEQRDDPPEGQHGAGKLAPGDPIAGYIKMRETNRDERQQREQDRRQAAVEKLLTPVDETVIGREQYEADPHDERPFRPCRRP